MGCDSYLAYAPDGEEVRIRWDGEDETGCMCSFALDKEVHQYRLRLCAYLGAAVVMVGNGTIVPTHGTVYIPHALPEAVVAAIKVITPDD